MISGRHPWQKTTVEDQCFSRFVQDPDFLLHMLPISHGANDILQRNFAQNPLSRITLPELRTAILEVDTFFLAEDELSEAGDYAQVAAAALKQPRDSAQATTGNAEGPRREKDLGDTIPERDARSSSPAAKLIQSTMASEIGIPRGSLPGGAGLLSRLCRGLYHHQLARQFCRQQCAHHAGSDQLPGSVRRETISVRACGRSRSRTASCLNLHL
ncbi:hypothetical protein BD414DRAFT_479566 [Trametes punicea]|nr:hypothetical protein BD414DRAFT_479566 [Trametes punicea]